MAILFWGTPLAEALCETLLERLGPGVIERPDLLNLLKLGLDRTNYPGVAEQMAALSDHDPVTGCTEWRGRREKDGYGKIVILGRPRRAHRVAYELAKGPIPVGLVIDHLCRNRGCVNAEHLEAVTNKVNLLRGNSWAGRNYRGGYCRQGHAMTGLRTDDGRSFCLTCARRRAVAYQRGRREAARADFDVV